MSVLRINRHHHVQGDLFWLMVKCTYNGYFRKNLVKLALITKLILFDTELFWVHQIKRLAPIYICLHFVHATGVKTKWWSKHLQWPGVVFSSCGLCRATRPLRKIFVLFEYGVNNCMFSFLIIIWVLSLSSSTAATSVLQLGKTSYNPNGLNDSQRKLVVDNPKFLYSFIQSVFSHSISSQNQIHVQTNVHYCAFDN